MPSKRHILKIQVTAEEWNLIDKIYGPKRHKSANIRRVLLDPYARRNPDQHKECMSAINAISSKLEELLKREKPMDPAALAEHLKARCAALALLRELHRHAA
jgi:hypothetical protein